MCGLQAARFYTTPAKLSGVWCLWEDSVSERSIKPSSTKTSGGSEWQALERGGLLLSIHGGSV